MRERALLSAARQALWKSSAALSLSVLPTSHRQPPPSPNDLYDAKGVMSNGGFGRRGETWKGEDRRRDKVERERDRVGKRELYGKAVMVGGGEVGGKKKGKKPPIHFN